MWTDGPLELILHIPSRVDPIGIMLAYINGRGVEPLSRMRRAELEAFTIGELCRLRPAAQGAIEVTYAHNWSQYPFSNGHIAYFAPGDISRYAKPMILPAGALYFAGEHCSRLGSGLQGACESAEEAAIQIMNRLSKA